ncbi:MAG TPA: glycosyltransferase family 39 protein, partial [Chitinophagaceae bacterium]|nr:glycosyltransferase family 39 protein [Chitinophagaceae bacterium]
MLTFLKSFVHKYHRALFYFAWLLLHIVQASTTDLFDDEAYYWVYSLFPDWGYFDHPPVIALLIKGGYALFHNELGVRFLVILLATASVFLVESLIEKKNAYLFYAIFGSLALAQIGGMIAVPDTPLLFSIALFFYLYKRFIANMNIVNMLLLGACIALMLYTKYHSILIVVFTGLSNLKLLRHYQTYLVLLLSIALFIPHLYWQHQHGYPSVQFHLFERNAAGYTISFTIEYIIGQIVLAGPLMGWLLLFSAFKYKPASQSEKALKFSFVGIYLFFLIATLRGKVEANWTVPAFISMIVLSHGYLSTHFRWRRWLYYSLPATLFLVFAARAIMM